MGSYSPQSYQQHSLAKHPAMPMANPSALSMFQDTSLWNPQDWMGDDQKQDRNSPIARYPTDASVDNKRMKYADWGRSGLLSTSSQQPGDEDPLPMTSRATSYQISDDVIQMFHTPSVLGLHAEHGSPRRSVESAGTASHYSQGPNAPLQMQVDSNPFVDMPYEPIASSLLQSNSTSQSLNGSSNPQTQTHNPNTGFSSVYIAEDNNQDMRGLNMPDTSYMYPDHHQKDDHQHMQTFSPVSAKPAGILRQPDVFPYGNQYPSQNELEEQQKKRRRDSYGGGLGMPIDRQSNMVNDEGQLDSSSAMPKRFRLTVQNAMPTMNAGPHYGGNPLYGNAMEASDSRMAPYGVHGPTSTPPVDQEFANYSQNLPTSPSSIKRLPNIKLVVKDPKVGKEFKPGKESKAHEDMDDDDFSETHVAETTVRQTSSVKPVATEASINQCSFVTDNAMLDTISVRKCNYILNQIYSSGCCLPFVLPVPKVLALYHSVITNPSDLSGVENRLWNSGYSSTDEFHHDIAMIWRNAEAFHKNGGDIADKAQLLKQVYFDALQQLEAHSGTTLQWESDLRLIAAEEQHFNVNVPAQLQTDNKSVLYVIRGIDIGEKPKARSFSKLMAEVFDILNASFYDTIKAIKDREDGGTEEVNELPLPRLFISKNRTMLEFAASDPKAVLTVLINATVKKCTEPNKKGLYHVQADAVLVHPLGNRHDLDQLHWPEKIAQAEYAPRAWIKVKILKIVRGFEADITEKMEREIFKRLYTTTRLAHDPKESTLNNKIAQVFVKSVIGAQLNSEDVIDYEAAAKNKNIKVVKPAPVQPAITNINASVGQSAVVSEASAPKPEQSIQITHMDAPLPGQSNTPVIQEAMPQTTDHLNIQKEKDQQDDDEEGQDMDQDDDQDLEYDYDEDEDGSYSRGGDDDLSQEVVSISKSRSPTPSRPEEAITFMRVIDNENEAAAKEEQQVEDEKMRAVYRQRSQGIWEKLVSMCEQNDISVIDVKKYTENVSTFPNAEGYFKQVYYVSNDPTVVVQTFRHMTMYQRITELVCLLKLRNKRHIGQMVEVLKEEEGEVIGLSMVRYQQTLKKYCHVHSHHRLSAHQKYHVIWQMLLSMKAIHDIGLAHRDLSEVNIMVNEMPEEKLEDGTLRPELFLIDFGKAIFCEPEDVRQWWCEVPRLEGDYDGDVVPETQEEMEAWCDALPWVKGKPDHGYKMYRSIQTLPKTRSDSEVLPYMIHPQKEDIYSIGVIIWKTFAETEPWEGVLDTDIKGLRYMVEDDFRIEKSVNKDVPGEFSRKLLFSCLKTSPLERQSAAEILEWFELPEVKDKLIEEWTLYAPEKRANRRAKTMYGRENSGQSEASNTRGRRRGRGSRGGARGSTTGGTGRGRGRPKGSTNRGRRGRPRLIDRDASDTRIGSASHSRENSIASSAQADSETMLSREASQTFESRASSVFSEHALDDAPELPVKRPVGRPRKNSIKKTGNDGKPPSQPRPVGRPPKNPPRDPKPNVTQLPDPQQQLFAPSQYGQDQHSGNIVQDFNSYIPPDWRNQFDQWPTQ
ncbi:hypothetical protein INT44_001048 [Umbelopsis vinacea]|uniref:Uncharacterized protein n=1 Tax=Umbelopsis vinacea TaxID=44442 RepID=A0A8H7QAI1_9FUNG|nr:hypothetical protein INT44_001048 [Umbelopsis vinacea]